jgi:hypothetical protein
LRMFKGIKLFFPFLLCISILFPIVPAFAATGNGVEYNFYYQDYRNEYRFDYWSYPGSVNGIHLHFVNDAGTVYDGDYDASALTGVFYFTCTGTYTFQLLNGTAVAASVDNLATSSIMNGTCSSHASGTKRDGLSLQTTPNADGSTTLNWTPVSGSSSYQIYKNGSLIDTVTSPSTNVTGSGSYTVRAVDGSGGTLAESDANLNGPPAASGGCDGCKTINDMLNCPEWSQYMGEWGQVIKNNVPPAPNWSDVADIMRDKIVPAIGVELTKNNVPLAKAIGDDLEAREKPVAPPDPLPSFNPTVPQLQDMPSKITTDLSTGIPDYTPDFSKSKPFQLEDPTTVQIDTTDPGYIPGPMNPTDKGYGFKPVPQPTGQPYSPGNAEPVGTSPPYSGSVGAPGATAPPYSSGTSAPGATPPPYTGTPSATMPPYSSDTAPPAEVPAYQTK